MEWYKENLSFKPKVSLKNLEKTFGLKSLNEQGSGGTRL